MYVTAEIWSMAVIPTSHMVTSLNKHLQITQDTSPFYTNSNSVTITPWNQNKTILFRKNYMKIQGIPMTKMLKHHKSVTVRITGKSITKAPWSLLSILTHNILQNYQRNKPKYTKTRDEEDKYGGHSEHLGAQRRLMINDVLTGNN